MKTNKPKKIREDSLTAEDMAGIYKVGRNWFEDWPEHGEPSRRQFVAALRFWAFHEEVELSR
jgi:hypothetical protein